jgi:two-component system, cell cycle response regulator DivK
MPQWATARDSALDGREHVNSRRSAQAGRRLTLRRTRPVIPRPQTSASRALRQAPLVLIVDDSVDTRELYSEYLSNRRLRVISAADGNAGVLTALSVRPDVIVMDLAMPVLSGTQAIARLKTDPRTRRVPIIVLTGYAFRAIEEGALEAGADAFLTKPCLPEDLEQHVRRVMRSR